MHRHTVLTVRALALMCVAVAMPMSGAMAQEKQHISFRTPAENTTSTTKTENLDLEDVPNHVLRVFEIHRTYPRNPPVIDGAKMVKSWTRGAGDRIDGTGTNFQYVAFVMESGEKIFARMEGFAMNDSGKIGVTIAGRITGGTGKLATIQGFVRETVKIDAKTGTNENRTEIEYSVAR